MVERSCVVVRLRTAGSGRRKLLLLLSILLAARAAPAIGQCNSAPLAVDDEAFHEGEVMVIDVLANDVEPDGEGLAVSSVTTTCGGTLSEDFGLVTLQPAAPASEECEIDYQVVDGRGASASATAFIRDTGLLFKDGFESGDTGAWSEVGQTR